MTALCSGPALAESVTPRHTVSLGIFASRGDYAEAEPTTMAALPISYKLSYGYWNVRLASSLVYIEGPGNIDLGPIAAGGTGAGQAEAGIGDAYATVSRVLPAAGATMWWEPYTKIKIPLADEAKGLGTGASDGELGTELSRRVGRVSSVFGKLFFRWRGDASETELEDGFGGSLGYLSAPLPRWSGGVAVDYREAATLASEPARELMLFLTRRGTAKRSTTLYMLTGFSSASPDFGAGLQYQF